MNYDPKTCTTAGALRGAGLDIPRSIPDCAWIPRFCVAFSNVRALQFDKATVQVSVAVKVVEPFRWTARDMSFEPKEMSNGKDE